MVSLIISLVIRSRKFRMLGDNPENCYEENPSTALIWDLQDNRKKEGLRPTGTGMQKKKYGKS
jgi:hypothetical protein